MVHENDMGLSGEVALVGHFDTSAIAGLLPVELAARIISIKTEMGVPMETLAAEFIHRGISTTLIGGAQESENIFLRSTPLSVALYPKRGGWSFVRSGLQKERKAILELLREIQPYITHAHWTMEGGRAVADWNGPKVLTIHDAAWECARLGLIPRPLSMAYTARWLADTATILRRFDHIIAVSPYVETYLRLRHRYRGEIRVIPNAILDLPRDLIVPSTFPKTGAVTFGVCGSLHQIKNVYTAVEAFRKLGLSVPGSRLLIFGECDVSVQDQGKSERIELRGRVPHRELLRSLVEEVDIWLHPSRIESHGIVICEAIQAGCPVIAGKNSGAVSWTLEYGRAGILVDIESIDEVSAAMRRTVLERDAYNDMVDYGREHIRTMFSVERTTGMHLKYYRDIAGR